MEKPYFKFDLLFIVNGSKTIGMGHISRCIKLCDYINKMHPHLKTAFLSFTDSPAREVLIKHNVQVIDLNSSEDVEEITSLLKENPSRIIVNDTWINRGVEYYKALKQQAEKLVVIDDSKNAVDIADLLINISPCKFITRPKRKDLIFCQGLKYLMLPFQVDSFSYEVTGDILIFFGGTDFRDTATKFAIKLAKILPNKKFTVIGKADTKLPPNLNLILPFTYPVTSLLKFHNIVITSGGTAMFESVYFKKPTFTFAAQSWEVDNIAYLEKKNAVKYIGSYRDSVNDLASKFMEYLNSPLKFDFNSNIIDGKGIVRIGKQILKTEKW